MGKDTTKQSARPSTLAAMRINPETDYAGVWFDYDEAIPGVRIRVCRWNNSKFREELIRVWALRFPGKSADEISTEDDLEITKEAAALTILTDWEGIIDEQGKEIPYSSGRALEFFRDPTLPDFWRKVRMHAGALALAYRESQQAALKN